MRESTTGWEAEASAGSALAWSQGQLFDAIPDDWERLALRRDDGPTGVARVVGSG